LSRLTFAPAAAGIIFVFLAVSLMGTPAPENVKGFYPALPESVGVWKKAETPDIFLPENLSKYIDGGAELYLSYNFQAALALKYRDPDQNEIEVDLFDMGSSPDAFGVFAHSRESIDSSFGQGSEYAAGLLTFWKDRYYVSILAYPETPAKKDVVFAIGRAIEAAIRTTGPLPEVIGRLPQEGLVPESVHYFHHYIWLNSFCFVSNDNVLNIGANTPAALGNYRAAGKSYFLLIVRYPDAAKAMAAAAQFRQRIMGGAQSGAAQNKEGKWTGLAQKGPEVRVVLNAPDAAAVESLLAEIGD
jgi:hypothetical protein